jgi:hypothetical protein
MQDIVRSESGAAFEQVFNQLDNVLRQEAGCTTELNDDVMRDLRMRMHVEGCRVGTELFADAVQWIADHRRSHPVRRHLAYMAALGFKLPAETITEWLALIPVLALEIGSALAGVLAMSLRPEVSGQPTTEGIKPPQLAKVSVLVETPTGPAKPVSASGVKKRRKRTRKGGGGSQGGTGSGGQRMPANVIDLLKAQGGRIEGGQRGIGRLLGVGKSRANELLHELAAAGAVVLATSKSGTTVQLAAA